MDTTVALLVILFRPEILSCSANSQCVWILWIIGNLWNPTVLTKIFSDILRTANSHTGTLWESSLCNTPPASFWPKFSGRRLRFWRTSRVFIILSWCTASDAFHLPQHTSFSNYFSCPGRFYGESKFRLIMGIAHFSAVFGDFYAFSMSGTRSSFMYSSFFQVVVSDCFSAISDAYSLFSSMCWKFSQHKKGRFDDFDHFLSISDNFRDFLST